MIKSTINLTYVVFMSDSLDIYLLLFLNMTIIGIKK